MCLAVCEEDQPSCLASFLQGFTGKAGPEGPQGPVGMYVSDSVAQLKKTKQMTLFFSPSIEAMDSVSCQ